MTDGPVHFFGIRHHGPGSARSLVKALLALKPDRVLIEGPAEGTELIGFVGNSELVAPVAILVYAAETPAVAGFYPFAEYSPEWQAMKYALGAGVGVSFIDLPQGVRMQEEVELRGKSESREAIPVEGGPHRSPLPQGEGAGAEAEHPHPNPLPEGEGTGESDLHVQVRADPIGVLGKLSGYGDGERWWDHVIESTHASADAEEVFKGVFEAMSALREKLGPDPDVWELRREAHMRQMIREAVKEGAQKIAVVTGAWHSPALAGYDVKGCAKDDKELLKGLPKTKVGVAWVPWSYQRLSRASGYGAGVTSPEWYHTVWTGTKEIAPVWLTRVARLMRERDLDASSAHVIEAARLATNLAAMRGRPMPTLEELSEAALSVICHADEAPMRLVHRRLIIGERIGEVPEGVPQTPVQLDFAKTAKRLRLALSEVEKEIELDLRQAFDLEKSQFLHRLTVLGMGWGERSQRGQGRGTFKETWRLVWKPEFAIELIDASRFGNSVGEAAAGSVVHQSESLPLEELTELLDSAILADLARGVEKLIAAIQNKAATTGDVAQLIRALPGLVRVVRYGDVRKTDTGMVRPVVDGLIARVIVGLPGALSSLDDDAARTWVSLVNDADAGVQTLDDAEHTQAWNGCLLSVADRSGLHGTVAGRAVRILRDRQVIKGEDACDRLGLALSRGADPGAAAAWLAGFIAGPGQVLVHDEPLLDVINVWLTGLSGERFVELLPVVRRAFADFSAPERRMIGEKVKTMPVRADGAPVVAKAKAGQARDEFDEGRAREVLPVLRLILGGGK
jgi:hypothetical protein